MLDFKNMTVFGGFKRGKLETDIRMNKTEDKFYLVTFEYDYSFKNENVIVIGEYKTYNQAEKAYLNWEETFQKFAVNGLKPVTC